eukprot:2886393-Heterocapsa_arctica.AAC.1
MVNGTEEDRVRTANTPVAGSAEGQEAGPKVGPRTPQAPAAQGTPPAGAGSGPMRGWDGLCVRAPGGSHGSPKTEVPK